MLAGACQFLYCGFGTTVMRGHKTSISLEDEFWNDVRQTA
jgi:predicted DNA-binding ribbon-helix-helix protein